MYAGIVITFTAAGILFVARTPESPLHRPGIIMLGMGVFLSLTAVSIAGIRDGIREGPLGWLWLVITSWHHLLILGIGVCALAIALLTIAGESI